MKKYNNIKYYLLNLKKFITIGLEKPKTSVFRLIAVSGGYLQGKKMKKNIAPSKLWAKFDVLGQQQRIMWARFKVSLKSFF